MSSRFLDPADHLAAPSCGLPFFRSPELVPRPARPAGTSILRPGAAQIPWTSGGNCRRICCRLAIARRPCLQVSPARPRFLHVYDPRPVYSITDGLRRRLATSCRPRPAPPHVLHTRYSPLHALPCPALPPLSGSQTPLQSVLPCLTPPKPAPSCPFARPSLRLPPTASVHTAHKSPPGGLLAAPHAADRRLGCR